MPISGIFVLWWKIFALKIGLESELMAVDKLFRSKHSEDPQAEHRKYSSKTEEVEVDTYFFSTSEGE